MKILSVGGQLFLEDRRIDGRTDGWTDRETDMTRLIVAFRSFANDPKNLTDRYFVVYIQYTFTLCSFNIDKRVAKVAKSAY
jgi:hypothetical protein